MKKLILLVVLLGSVLLTAGAQRKENPPKFSPEDFKKNIEAFITEEAELTPKEASQFFPLFHEMHNKQRDLNNKLFEAEHDGEQKNMTEAQYKEMLTLQDNTVAQNAQIQSEYTKKFLKVMSAKKVYKAIKAETKFHRKMLRDMGNRRRPERQEGK
jgi:Skp family chaperone for outer membrane proteins